MRIEEVLNLKKMEVKGLKIACISDTHNKHASIKIPEGVDVLVVAGDFTGRG
jgi:predicted phosphodiesterase